MHKCQDDRIFESAKSTAEWLSSSEAKTMLNRDPYWPKWHSPWWRMHLLMEMDMIDLVPRDFTNQFLEVFNRHYLHFFPLRIEEVPPSVDPVMQIVCQCALGSAIKMFTLSLKPDRPVIHWFSDWCRQYQMEDGGYNCDEAAYTRDFPKSSLISTLPMLEAMLLECKLFGVKEHLPLLEKGAQYYLRRGLVGSSRSPSVSVDPSWDVPVFPRFYEFDGQRVLKFLKDYAEFVGIALPVEAQNYHRTLETNIYGMARESRPFRTVFDSQFSRVLDSSGEFVKGKSESFPLLDMFLDFSVVWPWLEREFLSGNKQP
ncbi:MAG: hypothetical protein H3C47_01930 [Candidatus Cloacimonetes bacterium]|nr:hypothetical protein [Candidatus Cloacimonadota bacterium]